jgi:hypothetical protein
MYKTGLDANFFPEKLAFFCLSRNLKCIAENFLNFLVTIGTQKKIFSPSQRNFHLPQKSQNEVLCNQSVDQNDLIKNG